MPKTCPDCMAAVELHKDYPSSFWETLFQGIGLMRVKRCPNCNAAVFVVLGSFPTSRRRLAIVRERAFWFIFVAMLLVIGYVIFEALMS